MKVAVCPAVTSWLTGCVAIEGATLTLRLRVVLLTRLVPAFDTTAPSERKKITEKMTISAINVEK
jgi:hypothetical protein